MNLSTRPKIVILGAMSRHPVAGVVWQYVHYLVGFERLGYEVYYVEDGGHQPSSMLQEGEVDLDRSLAASAFIDGVLSQFDLQGRWAFHALHSDGRCYGMTGSELNRLYESAAVIINMHGATLPLEEHATGNKLVYLETDPVALQIELHQHLQETIDFLTPHSAFFTFGENYGCPDCALPVSDRFEFKPTRQPVVMDFWQSGTVHEDAPFTTIGNWEQQWREVAFNGEIYRWSKHHEFLKFIDLPRRSHQQFELALSRCDHSDRQLLEQHGWSVRDALTFSMDIAAYRAYIFRSRGEFTVAKDQNVRLRSGWFSDRSATYLAAGRPVITQDTGFANILPTGIGLFGFSTLDQILAAIEIVNSDYEHHSQAAKTLAAEYFNARVVLRELLLRLGL